MGDVELKVPPPPPPSVRPAGRLSRRRKKSFEVSERFFDEPLPHPLLKPQRKLRFCCWGVHEDMSHITVEDIRNHGNTGDIILKASTFADTFTHRNTSQLAAKGMGGLQNLRRKYQYSHVGMLIRDPPQDIKDLYRVGTKIGAHFRVTDAGEKERVFVFESSASLGGTALRPLCDVMMHWLEGHNEDRMHFVIRKLLPAQVDEEDWVESCGNVKPQLKLSADEVREMAKSPLTRHLESNPDLLTQIRRGSHKKNAHSLPVPKRHIGNVLQMPSPNRLYRGMSRNTNLFLNQSLKKDNQLNHHVLIGQYHSTFLDTESLWLWMREAHGKGYGITAQELKMLGSRHKQRLSASVNSACGADLKELFCSELVAETFQRMKLLPHVEEGGIPSSVILPGDFVDGGHVDDSLQCRFRLGPHLRLHGLRQSVEQTKERYPIQFTTAEEEVIRLRDDVKHLKQEMLRMATLLRDKGIDTTPAVPIGPTPRRSSSNSVASSARALPFRNTSSNLTNASVSFGTMLPPSSTPTPTTAGDSDWSQDGDDNPNDDESDKNENKDDDDRNEDSVDLDDNNSSCESKQDNSNEENDNSENFAAPPAMAKRKLSHVSVRRSDQTDETEKYKDQKLWSKVVKQDPENLLVSLQSCDETAIA